VQIANIVFDYPRDGQYDTCTLISVMRIWQLPVHCHSGVRRLASAPGKLGKHYLSNQLKFDVMKFFLTFNFTNIFKYTIYILNYIQVIITVLILNFENLLFSLYEWQIHRFLHMKFFI
jgi:hypothetical protein